MSFFRWRGLAEGQVTWVSQQRPPASSPWTDGWLRKGPSCSGKPQSHPGPRRSDPTTPSPPLHSISLCFQRTGLHLESSSASGCVGDCGALTWRSVSSIILFPQFSSFICHSIKKKKKKITVIKLKINVLTTRIIFKDVSELIRIKSYLKWDMMDSSIL